MLVATATPPAFEGVYNALVRFEESGTLVAYFLLVFNRIDLDGIVPDVINYSHGWLAFAFVIDWILCWGNWL